MGVAHGDDLQYIFSDIWGDDLSMSPTDTKFSRNIFAPLLTNFAKTSVPTPTITGTLCCYILSLYLIKECFIFHKIKIHALFAS